MPGMLKPSLLVLLMLPLFAQAAPGFDAITTTPTADGGQT